MGHRISSLPMAAMCPRAPVLGDQYGSGRSAAMSNAFHAHCADPHGKEAVARMALLSVSELAEVQAWVKPSTAAFEPPDGPPIFFDYSIAETETEILLCLPDGDTSLGHLDMAHVVDHEVLGRVAVVGDIKRQFFTADTDSLQLLGYLVAYMQKHNCDAGVRFLWYAEEGQADWYPEILMSGSRQWWEALEALQAAATHEGQAVTGPHCRSCYGRLHCPEHLLPAAIGEANPRLKPFVEPGPMTDDQACDGFALAKSLEDLAETVKERCKAHVRTGGVVEDASGKRWAPIIKKGRDSCPIDRIKKMAPDIADKLIVKGKPYESFGWVRPK